MSLKPCCTCQVSSASGQSVSFGSHQDSRYQLSNGKNTRISQNAGLVLAVASTATATSPQQPPQASQPESEQQPTQPSTGDQPIELVVTGEQDGYRAQDASTATKTDTPLRDVPASIQVIPRQIIEDRAVTQVNQALQNVSGVNASTYQGATEQIYIALSALTSKASVSVMESTARVISLRPPCSGTFHPRQN